MTDFSKGHKKKKNFPCKHNLVLEIQKWVWKQTLLPSYFSFPHFLHSFSKLGISETKFHTLQRPVTSTSPTFYRQTTKSRLYYCILCCFCYNAFQNSTLSYCPRVSVVPFALNLTNEWNSIAPTKTQTQLSRKWTPEMYLMLCDHCILHILPASTFVFLWQIPSL